MEIGPGTILGQYEIVRWLDRGGMGDVYVGKHSVDGVECAIKVIRPDLAGQAEFRRRFEEEARALARLDHPNILKILDHGDADGVTYLVMELAAGGSLARHIGKPWSVEQVVQALGPIAAALDYAHEHDVVHSDVKPSNILRRPDGTPLLADFGIFRDLAATLKLGQAYEIEGAPYYMAPERAAGLTVVEASDQYALACVAYELLTGRVPFNGSSPLAVLSAHISSPPPSAHKINAVIGRFIDKVLLRGLAKNPGDRYPSARAFIAALAAPQPTTRAIHPMMAAPIVAIVLVVAVIASGAGFSKIPGLAGRPDSIASPIATRQADPAVLTPEASRRIVTAASLDPPIEATAALSSLQAARGAFAPSPTASPTDLASQETPLQMPPATMVSAAPQPPTPQSVGSSAPTPAVATVSPTRPPPSVTSSPTVVASSTPSEIPASPTPLPTPIGIDVAPVLSPATSTGGSIGLSWTYSVALASDEWFDVRVWKDGQPSYGIANVKTTAYQIGGSYPAGVYNWTIAVIRRQGNSSPATLTVASPTLRFTWIPPGTQHCPAYPNCG